MEHCKKVPKSKTTVPFLETNRALARALARKKPGVGLRCPLMSCIKTSEVWECPVMQVLSLDGTRTHMKWPQKTHTVARHGKSIGHHSTLSHRPIQKSLRSSSDINLSDGARECTQVPAGHAHLCGISGCCVPLALDASVRLCLPQALELGAKRATPNLSLSHTSLDVGRGWDSHSVLDSHDNTQPCVGMRAQSAKTQVWMVCGRESPCGIL